MKFVVNMNLAPAWVQFLADEGHDAVHWSNVGNATDSDHDLMVWARNYGHIIMTSDLDFGALLAQSAANGPSVVQLRTESTLPTSVGRVVLASLDAAADDLRAGALLTIDISRTRLRILPFDTI